MLQENLLKIYETSFRENREMSALTDYFKGETFSYYEMAKEIAKIHLLFKKAGIKQGDKIALIGRNNPRWCITYMGTITYGAVIVPILQDFTPADIIHIIYPPVALLCFGVWLVILMVSHYVSLASMVAGCCFPVFTLISPKVNGSTAFVVFSFVIAILLIYTHRKNIERLKAGTESKTFIWKPRRVKLDDEERKKSGKEHDRE